MSKIRAGLGYGSSLTNAMIAVICWFMDSFIPVLEVVYEFMKPMRPIPRMAGIWLGTGIVFMIIGFFGKKHNEWMVMATMYLMESAVCWILCIIILIVFLNPARLAQKSINKRMMRRA